LAASVSGTEVGLELRAGAAEDADFIRVGRFSKRDLALITGNVFAPIVLPPTDYVRVTYRDATGVHTVAESLGGYQYFKVDRLSGVARAYASTDGVSWVQIGPQLLMDDSPGMTVGFRASGLPSGSSVTLDAIAADGGAGDHSRYYAVHTDRLGTPQVVTDAAKSVVWSALYEPFGEVRLLTAAIENNIRFPGQYFDGESGLHYNYFRDYDPSTGRYVESDPIGLGGGLNTYAYVSANPISKTDPNGLVEWTGSQTTVAAGEGGGAVRFSFNLTSECIDGEQTEVEVVAGGFMLSVGIPASFTHSRSVTFTDSYNKPNANVFSGPSKYAYASWAMGHAGYGYQIIQLGNAKTQGGGGQFGWDASLTGGAGVSSVVSTKTISCGCGE
jgi:RHS repeat-associated protein